MDIITTLAIIVLSPILICSAGFGAVYINEVELSPPIGDQQWVELYNSGDKPVDISSWSIMPRDDPTNEFIINSGEISAQGFYVIDFPGGWLGTEGVILILRNDVDVEVDRTPPLTDFDESDYAWTRYPDGSDNWIFAESTPGFPSSGYLFGGESKKVKFTMDDKVSGSGFVRVQNSMTGSDDENVKSIKHGSGNYKSEDIDKYDADLMGGGSRLGLNKSSLSATYGDRQLNITPTRSININSKWAQSTSASGDRDSPYISESCKYATAINSDVTVESVYSYPAAKIYSGFKGVGGVDWKMFDSESSQEYTGSFNISNDILKNDINIINSSVNGTGFVNAKKDVAGVIRTYEIGTGDYKSDEQVDIGKISLAKDIALIYTPINYSYAPNDVINRSVKWGEGTRSGKKDFSFIGTDFSNIKKLDEKTTVVSGINTKTSANFSGVAWLQADYKPEGTGSGEGIHIDDEYVGNYSFNRQISIMPVYNVPHLSVSSQGRIHTPECDMLQYTITMINDGNMAFGPVYIRDTFPSGTRFMDASLPPFELASRYANWSIPELGSGNSIKINIELQITTQRENYTNRVRAVTIYQKTRGKIVSEILLHASNYTLLNADWSGCGPRNISATFSATSDSKKPNIATYHLRVQNLAGKNMSVNITASLPQNLTFINSTMRPLSVNENKIVWIIKNLASDKSRTLSFMATANHDGFYVSRANVQGRSIDGKKIASIDVKAPIIIGNLAPTSTAYDLDWMPCDEEALGPNSWNDFVSSGDDLGCLCTGDN